MPPDELTSEEIAAALERWYGAKLTRDELRGGLTFLLAKGGRPHPGKTREEVVDGLEQSYVAKVRAVEAERGLAFARTMAFVYLDELVRRLAPAEHTDLIRGLPTRERHVYRARYGFDRPRRGVSVRPHHRDRAPRHRRRTSNGRRKARSPSGKDSEPDPPLDLLDVAVLALGWGRA
jgi:hypothetical protein